MPPEDPEAEIRERLGEEAVAWLTRLTSGEATEAERARFHAWYAQSPAHARAFDSVAGLWRGLGAVLVPRALRRSHRPWRWFWGLAALGALASPVLVAFYPDFLRRPFHDYATVIGEQESVRLPDGSLLHLNTDTTPDPDFSRGQRRVILDRGEAAFEVAKTLGVRDEPQRFTARGYVGIASSPRQSGPSLALAFLRDPNPPC